MPARRWSRRCCAAVPQVRCWPPAARRSGIAGETVWRVPSLALPDLRSPPPLTRGAGRRWRRCACSSSGRWPSQPHFALTAQNAPPVAQVCRRLDGIPLALELAAARLRGLSLEHLAARLDQRFRLLTGGSRTALPRQQTLQATVDWSYGLLSAAEQTLFHRLAVFSGGFSLEAAEAVCAGGQIAPRRCWTCCCGWWTSRWWWPRSSAGDVERYRLLETLRQYGRERLAGRGRGRGSLRTAPRLLSRAGGGGRACAVRPAARRPGSTGWTPSR